MPENINTFSETHLIFRKSNDILPENFIYTYKIPQIHFIFSDNFFS